MPLYNAAYKVSNPTSLTEPTLASFKSLTVAGQNWYHACARHTACSLQLHLRGRANERIVHGLMDFDRNGPPTGQL